jgi:GTP 3',8-cyclase
MPDRGTLVDSHGRVMRDLRISVTDRCNLRCDYCMPAAGVPWLPHEHVLRYEEIVRVARVAVGLGVTGIRLTGGEPTVRAGLDWLVRELRALGPDLDLSLTTNAIRLVSLAGALREAGLGRINVSLDTLDRGRFERITRRDSLAEVLAGLAAAKRAGFAPIKVNAVLMRGVNDDEAVPLARWARDEGFELRFVEWMPLDAHRSWTTERMVPAAGILAALQRELPLEPLPGADPTAPAELFRYRDGGGTVGVIASVTRHFCDRCDRIRLTADGQIRTCLFAHGETDLRGPLRDGASDEQLAALLQAAARHKQPGHGIQRPAFQPPERGMNRIGG